MSCGVMELSRISEETEGVVYALGSRLYHPSRGDPCAFFVWSDVDTGGSASEALKRFVDGGFLGDVTKSVSVENPKTGNFILIYTWAINHKNFKDWYARQRAARIKKVGT
jgi:hypothetical protein